MKMSVRPNDECHCKIFRVTLTYESGFYCGNPISESLTIEYNGLINYCCESRITGEEKSSCYFRARPETVIKLFDKIDQVRINGDMKSSNDYATDVGTYSIGVDYNGFNIETQGSFGFPEWSKSILRSIRMLFINYSGGFRPGLFFNIG